VLGEISRVGLGRGDKSLPVDYILRTLSVGSETSLVLGRTGNSTPDRCPWLAALQFSGEGRL